MTVEIVRDEKTGRIAGVIDNGRRRSVVRDKDGRLLAITGPSVVEERVDDVANQITGQINQLARRNQELSGQVDSLERQASGWVPFTDELEFHGPSIQEACSRLLLVWRSLDIRRMTDDEIRRLDRHHGGLVGGIRSRSTESGHEIAIRPGRTPEQTARTILHELAHCKQVEILREGFDEAYLADGGRFLEQFADELADRVGDDLTLVRARSQPSVATLTAPATQSNTSADFATTP